MPKPLRLLALALVLALTMAACGGDDGEPEDDGGNGDDAGAATATLTFGTSADPVVLDGALVSDGESLRAIDQIFEGLVTLEPGSTEVIPNLATEWETSEDGRDWTFTLRDDVTFHDGEPFNAEAVCYNFDRWYNFEGSFQNPAATYYWQTVFGGFKNTDPDSGAPTESNFKSCTVDDEFTVTISLNTPSSSFLAAMALTNFTFGSPAALEQYDANEGRVNAEGIFRATGTYGTEHPVGTGPFMFEEWVRNDHLTMTRNPDYWDEEADGNIGTLIFRPIPDNAARLQALETGEIQGYDLVEPQDMETISGNPDLQLLERPAFNVGYVGMNQAQAPLDDIEVRKAIAHAINRQEVVDAFYAGQGEVATQFMPPALFGYADDVTTYEYDPDKARQILEDAGYDLPLEIDFAYPTDVSRPYMPVPQDNFEAMVADLEDCCFKVNTQSAIWSPDYLDNVDNGRYGLYLLGWTGDFGDPDNFIGTFFQTPQKAWGFENKEIFDCLDEAETEVDPAARTAKYEECNRLIMDFLPGLPYVHTKPALAFNANVSGYQPSPVSLEPFSIVTVGGQ
ncbi:MAG TPA: ABC transporter substrate-binding protein [Actinomycetota bacterium]|nr:ABC transporter substrate-binding protein [Actinomycetota bacterium]